MAVTLTINGRSTQATDGRSLFDYAEALDIDVPTSCRKQGKCKECMVEVVEGMSALSSIAEPERHLKGNFRLSCQTCVTTTEGHVRCHTMRRGHMIIERHAFGLPISNRELKLDPAVTRDGDRILIDGAEVERSTGPILGIAMDLGTTTVVLRLVVWLEKRRTDRGRLVRESAAIRQLRRSCPASPTIPNIREDC